MAAFKDPEGEEYYARKYEKDGGLQAALRS